MQLSYAHLICNQILIIRTVSFCSASLPFIAAQGPVKSPPVKSYLANKKSPSNLIESITLHDAADNASMNSARRKIVGELIGVPVPPPLRLNSMHISLYPRV